MDRSHHGSTHLNNLSDSRGPALISDHVLRLTEDNVLTGTGNVDESGRPLCQEFGGNNLIDVVFNGVAGCRS